jgi:hypothetical protein
MDAADLRRVLADAGAEKLAAPEPDVRARDAWLCLRELPLAPQVQRASAAAPCTPDAVQSAEQSCGAREAAVVQRPPVAQADAARQREAAVQLML